MSARDELWDTLGIDPDRISREEFEQYMNVYDHALAERLRNVHGSGEGDAWNWWDAAEIPAACADLIDPLNAGPVRPDEEPTP